MSSQDRTTVDQTVSPLRDENLATADVFETATARGEFTTLLNAMRAISFENRLRVPELRTLLAPRDSAFARLPAGMLEDLMRPESRERLAALLNRHILMGRVKAADLRLAGKVKTMDGTVLPVKREDGIVRIGNAPIAHEDISCTNGMIQVLDAVLLPE